MDSGIENMEVDENDRREKRSLTDKVSLFTLAFLFQVTYVVYCNVSLQNFMANIFKLGSLDITVLVVFFSCVIVAYASIT